MTTRVELEHLDNPELQDLEADVDEIMAQLDDRLKALEERLSAAGLSQERQRKIELKIEKARRRGEEALRRARRKLERRRKRATRGGSLRDANLDVAIDTPVSEDERLLILEMLQGGSITVEQAEALLDALENA